jgi:hypothetical protein
MDENIGVQVRGLAQANRVVSDILKPGGIHGAQHIGMNQHRPFPGMVFSRIEAITLTSALTRGHEFCVSGVPSTNLFLSRGKDHGIQNSRQLRL